VIPFLPALLSSLTDPVRASVSNARFLFRRCRPSDPSWPSASSWERLNQAVGGHLIKVQSPIAACEVAPDSASCKEFFKALKNPYYIGDQVGLTQTSGWVNAWVSAPSAYAVAAQSTEDVAAAVNFARDNKMW
jgi:FAD/FMN-containing dehydrogenase